jgi:hypothetical protein
MTASIISLILLGLSVVIFFISGWLSFSIKALFRLAHEYHQQIRRDQRPSRIFLIRHGESQANVDMSEYSFFFFKFSFIKKIILYKIAL